VVSGLCDPRQVYACLWSHAGGRRGHIHFVVQPVTDETMARYGGAFGPELQLAMFAAGETPDQAGVEAFAEAARRLFAAAP
jgi:hypothetical protein